MMFMGDTLGGWFSIAISTLLGFVFWICPDDLGLSPEIVQSQVSGRLLGSADALDVSLTWARSASGAHL